MTECVLWTGGCSSTGYGYFYEDGVQIAAHVAAWEAEHGPVPAGFVVHHQCGNRKCVNPKH